MTENAKELSSGIDELLELAKDGRQQVDWVIRDLAIHEDFLDGLFAAIFLDIDKVAPSGGIDVVGKYREKFEKLCKAMPHVSSECLKMLGLAHASIDLFFLEFEEGELSIRCGALHLINASMALGAATALLPSSIGHLSGVVQAKRKAELSDAGRQGATVRNQPYAELREWALKQAAAMRGAHKDVARKLAAQLPEHLADASRDPERLIYDALRTPAKLN